MILGSNYSLKQTWYTFLFHRDYCIAHPKYLFILSVTKHPHNSLFLEEKLNRFQLYKSLICSHLRRNYITVFPTEHIFIFNCKSDYRYNFKKIIFCHRVKYKQCQLSQRLAFYPSPVLSILCSRILLKRTHDKWYRLYGKAVCSAVSTGKQQHSLLDAKH